MEGTCLPREFDTKNIPIHGNKTTDAFPSAGNSRLHLTTSAIQILV